MSANTILVTGGSGFIGGAALRALSASPKRHHVRVLVHRTRPTLPDDAGCELVHGDLTDARSLERACAGVQTVLHLAGHIGEHVAQCNAVNADGTASLVGAAWTAGVARIIYVSSAAVYGYAEHRDASEDQVVVAPATPVSCSRASAERSVLDGGGMVLRPLFVYGTGDTRFVPMVVRALRRLPFLVDRGRARLSVVAVDDLARALVALASLPAVAWRPGCFHVTDGRPETFREIAASLSTMLSVPLPRWSLPYPVARLALAAMAGGSLGALRGSAAHRLFLVARDHYYDSSRLWQMIGLAPGSPFVERINEYAGWYQMLLSGSTSEDA